MPNDSTAEPGKKWLSGSSRVDAEPARPPVAGEPDGDPPGRSTGRAGLREVCRRADRRRTIRPSSRRCQCFVAMVNRSSSGTSGVMACSRRQVTPRAVSSTPAGGVGRWWPRRRLRRDRRHRRHDDDRRPDTILLGDDDQIAPGNAALVPDTILKIVPAPPRHDHHASRGWASMGVPAGYRLADETTGHRSSWSGRSR